MIAHSFSCVHLHINLFVSIARSYFVTKQFIDDIVCEI